MIDDWIIKNHLHSEFWNKAGSVTLYSNLPVVIAKLMLNVYFRRSLYLDTAAAILPAVMNDMSGLFRASTVAKLYGTNNTDNFYNFASSMDAAKIIKYNSTEAVYRLNPTDATAALETGNVGNIQMSNGLLVAPTVLVETERVVTQSKSDIIYTMLNKLSKDRTMDVPVSWKWYDEHLRGDLADMQALPHVAPLNFPFGFVLAAEPLPDQDINDEEEDVVAVGENGIILEQTSEKQIRLDLQRLRVLEMDYNGITDLVNQMYPLVVPLDSGIFIQVELPVINEIKFVQLERFIPNIRDYTADNSGTVDPSLEGDMDNEEKVEGDENDEGDSKGKDKV
jgi:hypothetical protein